MTKIDLARQLIELGISEEARTALEKEFPELTESEDERIRKGLLRHFKNKTKPYWNEIAVKDIVAYLEKQKEQKPSTPEDIAAAYQMGLADGRREQNPAEWSEEDEDGFNIVCNCLSTFYMLTDDAVQRDKIDSAEMWLNNRFNSIHTNHWKPSEEQMNALLSKLPIINGSGDKVQNILESLYNDLKKLI